MAKPSIAHLERRKIEAEILIPMFKRFIALSERNTPRKSREKLPLNSLEKMASGGRSSLGRIYRQWVGPRVSARVVAVLRLNRPV